MNSNVNFCQILPSLSRPKKKILACSFSELRDLTKQCSVLKGDETLNRWINE